MHFTSKIDKKFVSSIPIVIAVFLLFSVGGGAAEGVSQLASKTKG